MKFDGYGTDDPRMGHILVDAPAGVPLASVLPAGDDAKPRIAFIGFPDDQGVARNGGRVGAAHGPEAALKYIRKVGTIVNAEYDVDLRTIHLVNAGPIQSAPNALSVEDAHVALRARVAEAVSAGFIPFVLGGGNNQSYPNARGLMDALPPATPLAVINIDAHMDVRPFVQGGLAHSGSPFQQLLNDAEFAGPTRRGHFVEFALQGSQCSAEHVAFLRSRDGRRHPGVGTTTDLVWLRDVVPSTPEGGAVGTSAFAAQFRLLLDECARGGEGAVFVSLDLDAVRGCDAPGVSCASPLGLTAQQALDICYVAGTHPAVKLVDLSEYNPKEEEYRTGRLVAMMAYYFAMGLTQRRK
ncbi:hypothetical protein H9P43_004550 [Blastocladiella emersonii ATCC 22665]|nr:hypothetical protein H9P43_004550 [Blastocladiella emersonii ATCC 22665]